MKREVRVHRRQPKSGKTESLMLLLHGYGADGADLFGLADPISAHLPNCAFVAPDAPEPCAINPVGRQWFPIPAMDGSSEESSERSFFASADLLDRFIGLEMERASVTEAQTFVLGFSQGTMMALHVAIRRACAVAGVIGFSGRLLAPHRLRKETTAKPPVLLVHGDADDVVPFSSLGEAESALSAEGFSVKTHVSPGVGHGISPDGLGAALGFVRNRLNS